jgi:hypothetical protein
MITVKAIDGQMLKLLGAYQDNQTLAITDVQHPAIADRRDNTSIANDTSPLLNGINSLLTLQVYC